MTYNQPVGFSLGGFTVGHAATMNHCSAVGTIVGVADRDGRRFVTVEFDEPQPVDGPEGTTSKRFELTHTNITSTWAKPDAVGREFAYAIRVAGQEFLKGDGDSMSMIFGNLDGRNFAVRQPWQEQTHQQWLDYMREQTNTPLELGAAISLIDRDGIELLCSSIGKGA